jgi:hypothetical protein
MEKAKKYFIRSAGKGEMKIYHLINLIDFSQLDIFFNSIEEIHIYAKKHLIDIVSRDLD